MSNSKKLETLLLKAEGAYKKGLALQEACQYQEARTQYLLAAENLLMAAKISPPLLARTRRGLSNKLLAEADALKKKRNQQVVYSGTGSPGHASQKDGAIKIGSDEQSANWLIHEKPSVRFDDVAGLDDVKEQIHLKLIYPFQYPDEANALDVDPGGGILLYGPPGTGKTMIARAVAGEIEAAFFAIKPSEIMSQWVGVAEQNIASLFKQTSLYPISVIFIDEVESLAPKRRTSGSTVMQRVVPQLLAELDGFEKRTNTLLFIGATNEPWAIDSAILRPGRLDRLVYVGPPNLAARLKILQLNLRQGTLSQDVMLESIAGQTEGFSGADITSLARRVRERVFIDSIQNDALRLITMADFTDELGEMRSSIDLKDIKKFKDFAFGK